MNPLIGHEGVLAELHAIAAMAEPPHALLMAGMEGTGRTRLALELARMLNCERGGAIEPPQGGLVGFDTDEGRGDVPCGECRPCRLIESGRHADVVIVGPGDTLCRPRSGESSHERHPDSRDIRICQVRGISDLVSRFAYEGRFRVVILEPADRLADQAGHAVLKTLEEPPPHTVFVLITSAPEAIIETIRSRCRRIDVRPVARETIEAGLRARGISDDHARTAAGAARGRPARAITFASEPSRIDDIQRVRVRLTQLAAGTLPERMKYTEELSERWRRNRGDIHAELDAWEMSWEEALRAQASIDPTATLPILGALRAVEQARADLLANCLARAVFDLMLMSFPRRTLAARPEGSDSNDA